MFAKLLIMRAARALDMLLLLQRRGRTTARVLAEELEVTERTILRDVEVLSEAGVPIYTTQGKYGGIELLDGFETRLTGLTVEEARTFFLVGHPGVAHRLGVAAPTRATREKLLAALPVALASEAETLGSWFLHDPDPWDGPLPPHGELRRLARSIHRQRVVEVTVADQPTMSVRPLGLVLKAGTWHLVHLGNETGGSPCLGWLAIDPADEAAFRRSRRLRLAYLLARMADEPQDGDKVEPRGHGMTYETILTEVVDDVLTITMNRPEKLNAWTPLMGREMATAVAGANSDRDIVAIVVTGAGRGFCAGADMSEVFQAQLDGEEEDRTPLDWVGLMRTSKPIIAAINGPAIGVGLSQVMSMDHLIGAAGAKISLRFVKIGVVPELASSHLVPMRVGFGKASELMLTGKTILAEEAADIGLIDRVVEPDQLMDAAYEMAHAMGDNPQASLRFTKQLLTENMSERSLSEVQRLELKLLNQAYTEPEHKEAIAAFLAKREPDFRSARG